MINKLLKEKYKFYLRNIFTSNLALLCISIIVILAATLHPFKLVVPANFSLDYVVNNFNNATFFKDQVNNVLLFLPFGFAVASFLHKFKTRFISQVLIVALSSCLLSLTVEIIQIFIPPRAPTPSDVYNNTLGGLLGLLCLYLFGSHSFKSTLKRVENSTASYSISKIGFFFTAYLCLATVIFIPWQYTASLGGWDSSFSLAIGNEMNGGRPWKGSIKNLSILSKSYSKTEVKNVFNHSDDRSKLDLVNNSSLLAFYDFNNSTDTQYLKDLTKKQPKLIWSKNSLESNISSEGVVVVGGGSWLKSALPTTNLTEKIKKTSEFTLISTIQSSDINQGGPARIISLSADAHNRNFTLGQEADRLVFRLRTPITGANGSDLKLDIPGVFTDQKEHRILITYSRALLEVYIDSAKNYHALNLLDLIPKEQILFYYGITFIPVGLCFIFVVTLARKKYKFYRFLLPAGILLPSLILESMLVVSKGKTVSLKTLVVGMLFTTGTMLLLKMRSLTVGATRTIAQWHISDHWK